MKQLNKLMPGDEVVHDSGVIDIIETISIDEIMTKRLNKYNRETGLNFNGHSIRVPSNDDINRHEKKQLVSTLNSTEYSNFNIDKLKRIVAEVEA